MSLGKPTLTIEQVMHIYKDLKPISPFATIDTAMIKAKTEEKEYYRLYVFIFLAVIAIFFCKYYFNRYYFSF
jgi:hypothetical protein